MGDIQVDFLLRIAKNYLNRIPDKKIERQFAGQKTPLYLELYDMWVVDTEHGVEYGDIDYIMNEFTRSGVNYHFTKWNPRIEQPDHEHSFSAVLSTIVDDPENFSYKSFEKEYSEQEIKHIEAILAKYREIGET